MKAAEFLASSKEPLCSRGVQQSYSVSSQAAAQAVSSSSSQCCRSVCIQTGEILSSLVLVIHINLFLLNSDRDLFFLFSCATTKVAYVSESKSKQFT